MLQLLWKSHRQFLRAHSAETQKLFSMLALRPDTTQAQTRPALAWVLLIDTSGSMRSTSGESKLDQARRAAHTLIDDVTLGPNDSLSVIGFDDRARPVLPLSLLEDRRAAHQAVERLDSSGGRTRMAMGLECALQQLSPLGGHVARRVVLLTDGQTEDEAKCREISLQFGVVNAPLIATGIGHAYNEALLRDVAQNSGGRAHHLDAMTQWNALLNHEMRVSSREVVLDVRAQLHLVRGVKLDSVARVYPSLSGVELRDNSLQLGNLDAFDDTIWLFEWSIGDWERPETRARLAQLSLKARTADGDLFDLPVQDVVAQFTSDERQIVQIDVEVLGYVQQKTLDRVLNEALQPNQQNANSSKERPVAKTVHLETALALSKKLNNPGVTRLLQSALDEVTRTGELSPQTRKSVMLRPRTQTVKIGASGSAIGPIPDDETIRRLTGA